MQLQYAAGQYHGQSIKVKECHNMYMACIGDPPMEFYDRLYQVMEGMAIVAFWGWVLGGLVWAGRRVASITKE